MTQITLKGQSFQTSGKVPQNGDVSPEFVLVAQDLSEKKLSDFTGKKKVLNIFPSLDTSVCATTVKTFYEKLAENEDVFVLNISKDLPFAHKRFCEGEGVKKAETLSAFRSDFAKDYGLEIADGPLKGLCSRVVLVLDEDNRVIYSEQVSEITDEPNYDAVLTAIAGS